MNGRTTWKVLDLSARSWNRVIVLTIAGTLCCIALAFAFDSYSFTERTWRLGATPKNNFIIPLHRAAVLFLPSQQITPIGHRA
jgi:hypothetical protein